MNSLNIISARVSPTSSPAPTRSNSLGHIGLAVAASDDNPTHSEETSFSEKDATTTSESNEGTFNKDSDAGTFEGADEKTPLLDKNDMKDANIRYYSWHVIPGRIANTFVNSIRWVLSTIAAPGVYLVACFCDEQGNFAPLRQINCLFGIYGGDTRKLAADYQENIAVGNEKQASSKRASPNTRGKHAFAASRPAALSSGTSSSGLSSESESDTGSRTQGNRRGSGSSARHIRSKSVDPSEEVTPTRRSIRIKLNNDEAMRQRKHQKAQSTSAAGAAGGEASAELSAQIKSPTSPVGALTRYPKTPAPPRPLIPRRQPSYIPYEPLDPKHLKTLILDLDETLIHSMSKGGRMGSGHMVEVRLNTTYVGSGGQQALGPQHPILYYVHKRPHCDEFLRKVRRWIYTLHIHDYGLPY